MVRGRAAGSDRVIFEWVTAIAELVLAVLFLGLVMAAPTIAAVIMGAPDDEGR